MPPDTSLEILRAKQDTLAQILRAEPCELCKFGASQGCGGDLWAGVRA